MSKKTLENIGFEYCGLWSLNPKYRSGVSFELFQFNDQQMIYAFANVSDILYVGICDKPTTSLHDRLMRYRNIQGSGQNERIINEIIEQLQANKKIMIYGIKPKETLYQDRIVIDMIRGLEYPLIYLLKPKWNISK